MFAIFYSRVERDTRRNKHAARFVSLRRTAAILNRTCLRRVSTNIVVVVDYGVVVDGVVVVVVDGGGGGSGNVGADAVVDAIIRKDMFT